MAVTLDGPNKLIVLDTATSFTAQSIHSAVQSWASLSANMQYLLPMSASGKAALGGGIFTDLIFSLLNGWKLKPSGYAANTQIIVSGTLITSDNTAYAVPPTTGSPVQWLVQATTAGTITTVSSGSGLSTAEHDKLMALPAATDVASSVGARVIEGALTADQIERIKLAALAGKRQGLGTATEQYMGVDGVTPRITLTPDVNGNGLPTVNGAP